MFNRNKQELYSIVVTDIEKRIIIQALADLRTKQESLNKKFDFIEDLILRTDEAPKVKGKNRVRYEAR